MKFVTISFVYVIVVVLLLFELGYARRNDGAYNGKSPSIIKKYFEKIVDAKLDKQKEYNNCIQLLVSDKRAYDAKKAFWFKLSKAKKDNKPLAYKDITTFLDSTNIGVMTGESIKCGGYIKGMMKSEAVINSKTVQDSIKNSMGSAIQIKRSKKANFITNFATYNRRHPLLTSNFMKVLNNKVRRRRF